MSEGPAAGLLTGPDGATKLVGVLLAHCGDMASGEALARPIKAFGAPVLDAMGPIAYCAQNQLLDGAFPKGALNYWKAQFLKELTDAAITTLVECAAAAPSPMCQIVLEHFHGNQPHRSKRYGLCNAPEWLQRRDRVAVDDPADTERRKKWCRDTYAALAPYLGTTRYVNYLADDEANDPAIAAAYGPKLRAAAVAQVEIRSGQRIQDGRM